MIRFGTTYMTAATYLKGIFGVGQRRVEASGQLGQQCQLAWSVCWVLGAVSFPQSPRRVCSLAVSVSWLRLAFGYDIVVLAGKRHVFLKALKPVTRSWHGTPAAEGPTRKPTREPMHAPSTRPLLSKPWLDTVVIISGGIQRTDVILIRVEGQIRCR
jgi:hypothetical protein